MNVESRSHRLVLQTAFGLFLALLFYLLHLAFPGIIPTFSKIGGAFVTQWQSDALPTATIKALQAILGGFVAAVIVGLPLGFLMGLNRISEEILDPYLNALYVMPFGALVPALIVWFGTGTLIRFLVVFFFAVFPITINTMDGAKTTPPELLNVTRSFGAGRLYTIRTVVLPHEIPFILAGLRLGIGRAVKGLVVTEILISSTGFGLIISRWAVGLQMEGVFSVVFLLMAMGLILTGSLKVLEWKFVTWETTGQ